MLEISLSKWNSFLSSIPILSCVKNEIHFSWERALTEFQFLFTRVFHETIFDTRIFNLQEVE